MNKEKLNELICQLDNSNQSRIMLGHITRKEYDYNRNYIHKLYDINNNQYNEYDIKKVLWHMVNQNIITKADYNNFLKYC